MCVCFSRRPWYSREPLSDMKLLQKAGCEMAEMFFAVGNAYVDRVAWACGREQNFYIGRA